MSVKIISVRSVKYSEDLLFSGVCVCVWVGWLGVFNWKTSLFYFLKVFFVKQALLGSKSPVNLVSEAT